MDTEAAIRHGTMQVTVLLLVAAALAIGFGVAGIGASLPIVVGLLVLTAVLFVARPDADRFGPVAGVDVGGIARSLWLAPLVTALALLVRLSATPGEVQAIGGLLGLAGMANYFLRPVYLLGYDFVAAVRESVGRANGR
ncbi:hypothetical protein BVU17_00330 [Haloarcula taiwanensis]|uniref:Uncharacterized protein n=1 Tax=Haloarcula taiwanensis TaxID=1932004 RepID=A0A2H4ZU93_9EURY|nr:MULTISPECIES: hypothetical protein [Haloarcula]AUG46047.1 hypothetical protein BVU17_00330 [Haloarcula taiwanensis]RLM40179.1 hypothetical protein DVK01_06415 [Haloarcula sp. Atlit-120R]RLM48210.1 hypothetical protein DVK00_06855 [Haloarcula sp. Atlit-47R]RLM96597.1 hypothetical protein D3D01_09355 [Haloarcula sp. Atlit-7R]